MIMCPLQLSSVHVCGRDGVVAFSIIVVCLCVCAWRRRVQEDSEYARVCVCCLGESEREFAIGVAGGAERKREASRERGEREQRDESWCSRGILRVCRRSGLSDARESGVL